MHLLARLVEHQQKRPNKTAVQYFHKKTLNSMSWQQVYEEVEKTIQFLADKGVKKGDRVAIYSNTCKEWGFIDLANMALGAITVPLYHSSPVQEIDGILEEVSPKTIVIQDMELFRKIKGAHNFDAIPQKIVINSEGAESPLIGLDTGTVEPQLYITNLTKNISQDDLATIIYTSGTSGRPKGVMISHAQIQSSCSETFPILGVNDSDKTLTFLPFSHVLGRMELWGHYFCGYCLGYAESIDRLKKNLLTVQPTVLVGVPRIFEKIYFGIKSQIEISKLKQKVFKTALDIGKRREGVRQNNEAPSLFLALQNRVAHKLVFSHIQNKLGGRLRFAISGGAPLEPSISNLFSACGITILEGYGLTETTAPIFINTLFENRVGTVGKAIGEVRTKFAPDGELLVKSKKVMLGYYKNEEATAEVFDSDGYFKTGDIGEIDEDGFLKLTDRKKDLIKTAGGKFIAPQKIQNLFSTHPLIGHVHVHGDKKKYVVALFTLEKDEVMKYKKENEISIENYEELTQCQSLQTEVRRIVANINSDLGSFETVKRYHVLDHEFTIESGHLTPSLKMKRKKIDKMYSDKIQSLYS